MGRLIYENGTKIDIDDRALAHLQIVITDKLRRGEPFTFHWTVDRSLGGGRTTVWIHPKADLVFKYASARQQPINRAWIRDLLETAGSPSGLYLSPEPPSPRTAT